MKAARTTEIPMSRGHDERDELWGTGTVLTLRG
jgi:hypothetical protein